MAESSDAEIEAMFIGGPTLHDDVIHLADYDAACHLALCISIVRADEQATKDERDRQAAFYGDEATTMLRDAVAKGYKDAAHMKHDKHFDALR